MPEVYPVGQRVRYTANTNHDGSSIYAEVVNDGPSFYGTAVLAPSQMFVALEQPVTNPSGAVVPQGAIFAVTSEQWEAVGVVSD